MKKITAVIIILVLILNLSISVALADGFSIHSGVEFGMTLDQVKAQESSTGFTVSAGDLSYSALGYKNDKSMVAITKAAFGTNDPPTVHGSIAGFDDSYIYYFFNDDKLVSAIYHFGEKNKSDRYDTVSSALESKYGEPMIENGQTLAIPTKGKNAIDLIVHLYRVGDILECPVSALRQWLIPVDNGYVVVYLIDFIYGSARNVISKEVLLSYSYITDSAFESFKQAQNDAVKQALEDEERKKEELNNDL